MGFMMLRENKTASIAVTQPGSNLPRHIQLLLQPDGHGFPKRSISGRSIRQVRFQQSFKLPERLVIKRHIIDLFRRYVRLSQTKIHGLLRKSFVVFFPSKPFLLRSGDQLPINNQSGGRIVIKR